ncbi:hypothetical protein PCANB_002218 [Pneumocystis canis]|nr:hypothetical protein PCK1_002383 [Pneumocystis canis]KAG5438888.1 hypothetical protein PCANB_002218 [Pneumocystis canis]
MAQNGIAPGTTQVNGSDLFKTPLAHLGMILPPLDIREIVEKTANYVSRNGIVFEEKIREKEKNNTKFCFLNPADPYYKYYEFRLEEHKKGKFISLTTKDQQKTEQNASKQLQNKAALLEPPKFYFSASLPAISAADLDILKLTAQFVARNGREFQTTLSQRESRNFQFDFLRPNHSLFQYFTKLVKQYTRILIPPKNTNKILERNIENKYQLLEVIRKRVAWQKYQEEQQKLKQEEEDREKIEYAQIDWHDFVVVETIEFTNADEQMDLPAPISLSVLQSATLEQKQMMSMYHDPNASLLEDTSYNITQSYSTPVEKTQPSQEDEGVEMDIEADSDEETTAIKERREHQEKVRLAMQQSRAGLPMKIRTNYVPKALNKAENTLICPQCNLAIPSNELEEHMRIEMLDPKWKEQKAKAESKSASSNLYQEGAASNLKRMTASMYDMQGNSMSKEEMERNKRQR